MLFNGSGLFTRVHDWTDDAAVTGEGIINYVNQLRGNKQPQSESNNGTP